MNRGLCNIVYIVLLILLIPISLWAQNIFKPEGLLKKVYQPTKAPYTGIQNDFRSFINPNGKRMGFQGIRPNVNRRDTRDLDISYKNIVGNNSHNTSEKDTQSDVIPFKLVEGWPIVELVFVNGEGPFSFMVDLGASGLGRCDQSLYEKLNLEISGTRNNSDGFGNTWTQKTVAIDHIKFGTIEYSDIDLPMRDYWEGVGFGILGLEFFEGKLLIMDYPNQEIKLNDGSLTSDDQEALSYDHPFHVKGTVTGVDFTFSIDTGSQLNFHFPKSFLEDHDIPYVRTGKTSKLKKSGGVATGYEAKVDGEIIIGGIKLKNPLIWYSKLQDPNRINVGGKVLKDYVITVDQKNQLIHFTKNGLSKQP